MNLQQSPCQDCKPQPSSFVSTVAAGIVGTAIFAVIAYVVYKERGVNLYGVPGQMKGK